MKSTFIGTICAAAIVMLSSSAKATYDAAKGGWTEVINCPGSSFRNQWGNGRNSSAWGTPQSFEWTTTPTGWWTYAHSGGASTDCDEWIDGEHVGGATYTPGVSSTPKGTTVNIDTYWYDFNQPGDYHDQSKCGHQHAVTYVWGWRYFGSSWSFEFVKAHMITSYWNAAHQTCEFQAAGNPAFAPPFDGYAFGPMEISIPNSPYVVLYEKSQAISHYQAGCGQFECFHPVEVLITYN